MASSNPKDEYPFGPPKGVVCVTGATGYLASQIVKLLLERGHRVKGTVRDVSKTAHLRGLGEGLELYSADLVGSTEDFVTAFEGCDAVFHAATPVRLTSGGEDEVYAPAMEGLDRVLEAMDRCGVGNLILTSSMAAVAPKPEPSYKSEIHWSDAERQKADGNWYGAAKTDQEIKATEWCYRKRVRMVAICPTMVLGPMLQPTVNATMRFLADVVDGTKFDVCPNDTMSFIDVRDCAAHHVLAYEDHLFEGRFMSLVESLHWNDILNLLKDIVAPRDIPVAPCVDARLARPTRFDKTRMSSLRHDLRPVKDILRDAVKSLKERGAI